MSYLITFDLETTGLDRNKDFIIQISGTKRDKETGELIESLNEYVQPEGSYSISMAAFFKHHIKPDFLKDKPTLRELAPKIIEFFGDESNDILTYNGNNFDIPFLLTRLNSIGYNIDFIHRNCYDVFLEEKRRNGNKLNETFTRYVGKSMIDYGLEEHNAFSDIEATYMIFKKQNEINKVEPEKMYGEDGVIKDMIFQGKLCPCFSMGKYREISIEFISTIDQGYLKWAISDKCNFMKSTKEFIKQYVK